MLEQQTESQEQTESFASSSLLPLLVKAPCVLLLRGPLGAGKTTVVRGLVRGLDTTGSVLVQSPTFALLRTYATVPPVRHLDLYRLQDVRDPEGELEALGVFDVVDEGITVVEWPLPVRWPVPVFDLTIEPRGGSSRRLLLRLPDEEKRGAGDHA